MWTLGQAETWVDVIAGIVILSIILAVLRGWLVPSSVMKGRIRDRDELLNGWRESSQAKDKTIAIQSRQINELYESGRLAEQVMSAVKEAIRDDHADG